MKSCAENKLRTECGSKFVAYAIWEIGLPQLPSFATEQRDEQLSKQALETVPEAIQHVLSWLDVLAHTLSVHKATPQYSIAVRKSGTAHCQSGLTATELQTRSAIRTAKYELRTAKELASQWKNGELTHANITQWEEKLLHGYWDGSLRRHLQEVTGPSNRDPMCRTPSVLSTR